jgi:ATP-binding cassette subfamily F protein uup
LGAAGRFADYLQWEAWQETRERASKTRVRTPGREIFPGSPPATTSIAKKKLSYLEAREYATLGQRIAEAEDQLKKASAAYEDPAIVSDADRLIAAQAELHRAQELVDQLYARWEELETKMS